MTTDKSIITSNPIKTEHVLSGRSYKPLITPIKNSKYGTKLFKSRKSSRECMRRKKLLLIQQEREVYRIIYESKELQKIINGKDYWIKGVNIRLQSKMNKK